MSFDKDRRGRRKDKRDSFGDENYQGYNEPSGFGGRHESGGHDNRGGGGAYRGGGAGGAGGGAGGGFRGGGDRMPAQIVGEGKGIVKFFNGQKGFGFIVRDDGGEDVFVHISAVEQAGLTGLAEGQPLGFNLVDRNGKVSASDLVIDGDPLPVPGIHQVAAGRHPVRHVGIPANRYHRHPEGFHQAVIAFPPPAGPRHQSGSVRL